MNDCLFCKIIAGQIPSNKVYEDEFTYAFHDIAPQAKTHVLVVSKKHTPDVAHHADLRAGKADAAGNTRNQCDLFHSALLLIAGLCLSRRRRQAFLLLQRIPG